MPGNHGFWLIASEKYCRSCIYTSILQFCWCLLMLNPLPCIQVFQGSMREREMQNACIYPAAYDSHTIKGIKAEMKLSQYIAEYTEKVAIKGGDMQVNTVMTEGYQGWHESKHYHQTQSDKEMDWSVNAQHPHEHQMHPDCGFAYQTLDGVHGRSCAGLTSSTHAICLWYLAHILNNIAEMTRELTLSEATIQRRLFPRPSHIAILWNDWSNRIYDAAIWQHCKSIPSLISIYYSTLVQNLWPLHHHPHQTLFEPFTFIPWLLLARWLETNPSSALIPFKSFLCLVVCWPCLQSMQVPEVNF